MIGDYLCRRQEGPSTSEKVCGSLGKQKKESPSNKPKPRHVTLGHRSCNLDLFAKPRGDGEEIMLVEVFFTMAVGLLEAFRFTTSCDGKSRVRTEQKK